MLTVIKKLFSKKSGYISQIDIFLQKWDKTHPKSRSQRVEFEKYQKIYQLRDKKES